MPEEGFLRRWARRKTETKLGLEPAPEPALAPAPGATPVDPPAEVAARPVAADAVQAETRLPTMDDVARLSCDSDFSAFVARGVDQAVRRSALKKLFADPHFQAMDGLDVYIDDYTKPSPVSEAMLASFEHAKSLFRRPEDAEAGDAETLAPEAPAAIAGAAEPAEGGDTEEPPQRSQSTELTQSTELPEQETP